MLNPVANEIRPQPRPLNYWRLYLLNALLVSVGLLVILASPYGTGEFFGVACLMALLPFIPVMVLVGGAGSTLFVLTKIMIEKRSWRTSTALVLLVGPGLALFLALVLVTVGQPPSRRLAYICHGSPPASASRVQVTGYATYLSEQWLAVFTVDAKGFQALVTQTELAPVDGFEFKRRLEQSALKSTRLYQSSPFPGDLPCFKRVFKPGEEHERGSLYALFDPATSRAMVFREYRD
jgi:hypothetical protein